MSFTNTVGGNVTLTPAGVSAVLGTDTGTIQYSTNGGTTWQTLTLTGGSGTVTVAAGVGAMLVRIPTTDDTTQEPTETLTLTAGTPANTAPVVGLGTILDNDRGVPQTRVTGIGDATVMEGGNLDFTVTLSDTNGTTVNLTPQSGTAILGTDTGTPLQVSFNGGSTWSTLVGTSVTVPAGSGSFMFGCRR